MRIRKIVISSALAISSSLFAQTAPSTTVCLAKIEGQESQNWNLRPSIVRELAKEFVEQRREVNVLALDAANNKHAANEASAKHCDFVVYSDIERVSGEVNSQMNPDITKRGIVTSAGSSGSSVLRYSFTVKDAKRSKVSGDKVQMEILPSYGPKEFEQSGRTLVSDIVDKLVVAIPKQ
jgi:predicted flavoprotein YhiN